MNWPPAHPMAPQEFDHIVDYLRANVTKALAHRFILNVMETVKRARQFPASGSPIRLETRRMQIAWFGDLYLSDALDGSGNRKLVLRFVELGDLDFDIQVTVTSGTDVVSRTIHVVVGDGNQPCPE